MGAVWIGRERAQTLIEHYGADVVAGVHAGQLQQSARAFSDRLARLPDGVYEGAAHMEHDGASDKIYTIRMRIIKEGNHATFDYTGTDAQAPGVLNCTYVGAVGNVMAALGTIFAPDIPFNEGLMQPVEIRAPEGTLVNAIKPAPISGATVYAAWFGTDAILEAANYLIADAADLAHRRTGPWGCWTFAWLQATNQHGELWFWNVFTGGSGGGGALPDRDGENAILGIQTIDAFTPNIEEYEIQSPLLFVSRGFAVDSGGAGRYRGGLALESLCVPYQCDGWDVTVFHNRLTAPSSSVSGGYPGSGSAIEFSRDIRASLDSAWQASDPPATSSYVDRAERLPTRAAGLRLNAEDGYYMRATGGPGLGDPIDRPAAAVAHDVKRGFVSRRMAAEAYGVVLDETGEDVDEVATEARRASVRAVRQQLPLGGQVLPEGEPGADPGPVEPRREQVLGEYLGIDATGQYRCRRCGFTYCSNAMNWKWFARCSQAPVGPDSIRNTIRERSDQDLVARVYVCPGCATQVDLEIALRDEPARWNYRPLALWQRNGEAGSP
jgi:N-methylhydantoinase B